MSRRTGDDDPSDAGGPQRVRERAVHGGREHAQLRLVQSEDQEQQRRRADGPAH